MVNFQDHPRLCGEKTDACSAAVKALGSPPPMRGKGVHAEPSAAVIGITPAYAGKRLLLPVGSRLLEDHPRLCGEKLLCFYFPALRQGSPPPMRGKVLFLHILAGHLGITPAYAGKR